jgi:hypothetical protein
MESSFLVMPTLDAGIKLYKRFGEVDVRWAAQVSEAFCLVLMISVDWNASAVRTEGTAASDSGWL